MTFLIERWGIEDESWNLETGGHPGIALVANAIGVWCSFQERPTSVAETARVFNIDPSRIIEAVEFHAWMFLAGPEDDLTRRIIKLEGE